MQAALIFESDLKSPPLFLVLFVCVYFKLLRNLPGT